MLITRALMSIAAVSLMATTVADGQIRPAKVWDIPQGKACFERWISTYKSTLNSHNGGERFNKNKPYGISPYGHKTFSQMVSYRAPTGWATEFESNRYKYLWHPSNQKPGTGRSNYWWGEYIPGLGVRTWVGKCLGEKSISVDNYGNVSGSGLGSGSSGSSGHGWSGRNTKAPYFDPATRCNGQSTRNAFIGTWTGATRVTKVSAAGISYNSNNGRLVGGVARGCRLTGYWVGSTTSNRCKFPRDGSYYWGKWLWTIRSDGRLVAKYGYCDNSPSRTSTGSPWSRRGGFAPSSSSGSAASTATATGSSQVRASNRYNIGINRPGGDYYSFPLSRASATLCRQACDADARCRAWTYVKPGVQDRTRAKCWLKSRAPAPKKDNCCTSGVVR
ncbi:MAG: PAN domain-containing protein [Novosphingobium sp.]|nr:PAN domain-containing protein [Novosphingobium sp.]